VELAAIVAELDAYFRVPDVRDDDWSRAFDDVYPAPYWRDYVEPGYEGRWNGLMVRGADTVDRVVTCVFPSDRIVAGLEPRTLLFSEHPLDFADRPGFLPLARESFDSLHAGGSSFYHVHAPLDMHEEVAPSLLVARGVRLTGIETYYPAVPRLSVTPPWGSKGSPTRCASSSGRRSSSTCSRGRGRRRGAWRSSRAAAPTWTSSACPSSAAAART
jgi:hypothetical protein